MDSWGRHCRRHAFPLMLACAAWALGGCQRPPPDASTPSDWYVLSDTAERAAALQRVDSARRGTQDGLRLKQAGASTLAAGPDGRVWVGGRSVSGLPLTSMTVLSADLQQQTRVTVPANPGAGLAFSRGKVIVGAALNGFGGAVAEVDPDSLATRSVSIPAPANSGYILTALAASDQKIVVAGMTNGPDPQKRYAQVTVIDPQTLQIVWRSDVLESADFWRILPHGDDFVLLNAASAEQDAKPRADVLLLSADNRLTPLTTQPAPLWGTIQGDVLYAFHNPNWNTTRPGPQRQLTAYHLGTQALRQMPLPDGTYARDLALDGDRILLSVTSSKPDQPSGVYAVNLSSDSTTPALTLVAPVSKPGQLLQVPARPR